MPQASNVNLKAIITYGVMLLFAAWCIHSFQADIRKIDFNDLHGGWWAVLVAGLLSLLNYALRIMRWGHYLRHMGHALPWRLLSLTYVAGFAFTLSPGKVGEMVRARYYQPYNIPLKDVTAAFFAERLMDLITILLMALAMLAGMPQYHLAMWAGIGVIGGCLLMLLFMPWNAIQTWLAEHPRAERSHLKVAAAVANMLLSARSFFGPRMLFMGLGLSVLAWGAEAVGFKIVGDVIDPQAHLTWTAAMGIYATAILIGALSFLPGGLGGTEAVMASLLFAHGFPLPAALLLTLLCRILTLWLAVLIGWLAVWMLRHDHPDRR